MGSTTIYQLPYTVNANPANMPPEESAMMGAVERGLVGRIVTKTVSESRPEFPVGTLAFDDQMRLAVVANAVYKVEMYLIVNCDNGINFQLFGPTGTTGDIFPDSVFSASVVPTANLNRAWTAVGSPFLVGPEGVTANMQASIYGFITIGAVGGPLILGWGPASPGSNLSNAVAILLAGSKMRLRRIA